MINKSIQNQHNHDTYRDESDPIFLGNGDIVLHGNLKICGTFSGKLKLTGTLTIVANARFTGEIDVIDLVVHGQIIGSAKVQNKAIFHDGSSFSGTLSANEGSFHEGANISGIREIGQIVSNVKQKSINDYINTDLEYDLTSSFMKQPIFSV